MGIQSSIALPELEKEVFNHPHINIKTVEPDKFPKKGIKLSSNTIKYEDNDIGFLFENRPLFRVKDGKEILINSNFDLNLSIRCLILGPGMGILFHQRGYLTLHGSAVSIGGKCVAFLGSSESGKSTIAAALTNKGHNFIADDILVIDFDMNDKPILLPSFPEIKLWEDGIPKIKCNTNLLKKIHPTFNKYSYNVKKNFNNHVLPLEQIYLIEKDHENYITPIKSQKALLELIKNSYSLQIFNNNEKSKNLTLCAEIVRKIPIKILKRSLLINEIENLISIIEKDISYL